MLHNLANSVREPKCSDDSLLSHRFRFWPVGQLKILLIEQQVEQVDIYHVANDVISKATHDLDGVWPSSHEVFDFMKFVLVPNLLDHRRISNLCEVLARCLAVKNDDSVPGAVTHPTLIPKPPLLTRCLLKMGVFVGLEVENQLVVVKNA